MKAPARSVIREEAVTFEARMILGRAEPAGRDSFTAKRTREANPEVQDITVINTDTGEQPADCREHP